MRTVWRDESGGWCTSLRGRQVLADPRINKGTAFTDAERAALGLVGLMPAGHMTLAEQVNRVYAQYQRQNSDLGRNVLLNEVHDRNEVLFYKLLVSHLSEMLPIVYTPTIGQAIEQYSHEYRRPRGVYLSVDHPEVIEESLRAPGLAADEVDLIVATDAGAILGIGDWGVGGIHIAVGKLAVYTAAGGIDPDRTLPVILDVGTDRQSLLDDPLYIGNRHPRVPVAEYDTFLDAFVSGVREVFPHAFLHWEDIGVGNARRLLDRYRDHILSFNDDIQGTGAVNLAAVLAAVRFTGVKLTEHKIVIFGAGTAGTGIADQLSGAMAAAGLTDAQARARFWAVDRTGLLTGDDQAVSAAQRRYARPAAEVAGWARDDRLGGVPLAEVVRRAQPTILIGTSGRPGAFTEQVVREMAAHVRRPVIMPMSNPTELAEAQPADLISWTGGRALVATGSPFGPVDWQGIRYVIGQANNALVFPGLGLGVIAAGATKVTDGMLSAAAHAVADLVDTGTPGAPLLPEVANLRGTSLAVAIAVALAAEADGVATRPSADLPPGDLPRGDLPRGDLPRGDLPRGDLQSRIRAMMWQPEYRPVRPA